MDVDRESVTNALIGLKSGDTQTKAGVKYVNGTLTAYNSTKTKIKPSVAEDYTLTGTYEQGKYLRTTDTGTKVADFDWGKVGSVALATVEVATLAVASIAVGAFVVSTFGVGWLVGSGLAAGTAAVLYIADSNEDKNDK